MSSGSPHHYVHRFRVPYPDVDRMGFVHHARYAAYFETARIEFLRHSGMSYREWEERGILIPVTRLSAEFHRPGQYDDELEVRLWMTELTRLRLAFRYEVHCPARAEMLASGESAHVFMNKAGRPMRIGPEMIESLRRLSGGEAVEPGED